MLYFLNAHIGLESYDMSTSYSTTIRLGDVPLNPSFKDGLLPIAMSHYTNFGTAFGRSGTYTHDYEMFCNCRMDDISEPDTFKFVCVNKRS